MSAPNWTGVSLIVQPAAGHEGNHSQRCLGAIGNAFLKVAVDAAHLIGDVREAHHGLRARRSEGVQACRLHLYRKDSRLRRRINRLLCLAEGRGGRPTRPDLHGERSMCENLACQPYKSGVGLAVIGRRQIV